MMRPRPHRQHPLWLAFIAHRISGLALALFLPAHFWVLATALEGEAALDSAIAFSELAVVKLAEGVLVFLLAVHVFGGLRLLALELLPWTARQKTLAAGAVGLSVLVSGTFLLQAV
ncbi:MAG: succinate dehydrogenase, cytochrome b556 subunit [Pseudomonadota bacterium]